MVSGSIIVLRVMTFSHADAVVWSFSISRSRCPRIEGQAGQTNNAIGHEGIWSRCKKLHTESTPVYTRMQSLQRALEQKPCRSDSRTISNRPHLHLHSR